MTQSRTRNLRKSTVGIDSFTAPRDWFAVFQPEESCSKVKAFISLLIYDMFYIAWICHLQALVDRKTMKRVGEAGNINFRFRNSRDIFLPNMRIWGQIFEILRAPNIGSFLGLGNVEPLTQR